MQAETKFRRMICWFELSKKSENFDDGEFRLPYSIWSRVIRHNKLKLVVLYYLLEMYKNKSRVRTGGKLAEIYKKQNFDS